MFAPRARDACGAFWSRDKMIEALEKNVPHWDYPEYKGEEVEPELHKEPLKYEFIEVKTRNYKD